MSSKKMFDINALNFYYKKFFKFLQNTGYSTNILNGKSFICSSANGVDRVEMLENGNEVGSFTVRTETCKLANTSAPRPILQTITGTTAENRAVLLALFINLVRNKYNMALVNITNMTQNQEIINMLNFFGFYTKYTKQGEQHPVCFTSPGQIYMGKILKKVSQEDEDGETAQEGQKKQEKTSHTQDDVFALAYNYGSAAERSKYKEAAQIEDNTVPSEPSNNIYHRIRPEKAVKPNAFAVAHETDFERKQRQKQMKQVEQEEEEDDDEGDVEEDLGNIQSILNSQKGKEFEDFDTNALDENVDINMWRENLNIENDREPLDFSTEFDFSIPDDQKRNAVLNLNAEQSNSPLDISLISDIDSDSPPPPPPPDEDTNFNFEDPSSMHRSLTSLKKKHLAEQQRFIEENKEPWARLKSMAEEITGQQDMSFDQIVDTMLGYYANRGGNLKRRQTKKRKNKSTPKRKYYMKTKKNKGKKYFSADQVEQIIKKTFEQFRRSKPVEERKATPIPFEKEIEEPSLNLEEQRDLDLKQADRFMMQAADKQEEMNDMEAQRLKQVLQSAKELLDKQQEELMSINQEAGFRQRQRRRRTKKRYRRRANRRTKRRSRR